MKKFGYILCALMFCVVGVAQAQIITYSQTTITKMKLGAVEPGFQQSVELEGGYTLGELGDSGEPIDIGVNYVAGYRFNNTLFIGGGIGVGYYDDFYASDCWANGWEYEYDYNDYTLPSPDCSASLRYGSAHEIELDNIDGMYVQAFANVKVYLSKGRVQPFFDLSVGGLFATERLYYNTTIYDGYCEYYCDNPMHDSKHGSQTHVSDYDETKLGLMIMPQFGLNFRLRQKLSLYFNVGYKFLPSINTPGCPLLKVGMAF